MTKELLGLFILDISYKDCMKYDFKVVLFVRISVVLCRSNANRRRLANSHHRMEASMRMHSLYDVYVRNDNVSKDTIALMEGDETCTFHELHTSVLHAAEFLSKRGVARGDRVAILSMNRLEFFILLGALARLGAIMVPLNWRLSLGELVYIIGDCLPKCLFTDAKHSEIAKIIQQKCPVEINDINELRLKEQTDATRYSASDSEAVLAVADTPLCIIYTAAVEGHPRGAVLSHSNLIAASLQVITSMGLSAKDVNLNMLPLFHITGLNLALAVMQVGGRNVIIEKFDEQKVLEITTSEKVTLWGSFPPILTRCMAEFTGGNYDISSLKYVVGLDGPEMISSFEEKVDAKFWILYGQSETSGFVTFSEASKKLGSAGQQGCLVTFCLLDEYGVTVKTGETGEIAVRGPLVFQGYWNLEAVNEKTFRQGWHHTGDLGQLDTNGYLYFKGRKPEKELIKPGGENVYPAEVETVILEHKGVKAVCVIGVPDPKFGEGIKAVCVLNAGVELEKKELIEFVAGRIARYKKPQYVEFVASLPQQNEMIDRNKVKELWG